MKNIEYCFGEFSINGDKVPVPDNLKSKDARADPIAKVAVFSANDVVKKSNIENCSDLSVIVVNREGCKSHVNRITDGISKRVARQGFFARGGPQTLATYTALALSCHGAAYTLVGEKSALNIALASAIHLSKSLSASVIITTVAKNNDGGYKAVSALIKVTGDGTDYSSIDDLNRILSSVYE